MGKQDKELKKRFIGKLLYGGARAFELNKNRQQKLEKWILPYITDEFDLYGGGGMNIENMREFIDRWEHKDLKEIDHQYYYVNKDSRGKSSLWEKHKLGIIIGVFVILYMLFK